MSDVQLDYVVPSGDLAGLVTVFYRFRADVPLLEEIERADYAQLRFRLSPGASHYQFPDGTGQDAPPIHVIAATSGAMRTRAVGPVHVFGCGLTPAGWHALLGHDASAMLNRVIDAEALFGDVMNEAVVGLRNAPDTAGMAEVGERLLRRLMAEQQDGATLRFVHEVDAWLAGSPSPEVEELARRSGLSRRQVERRCKALYGFPPKLLARKYRALRAAVAIARGSADAELLIADGFYDQSHMIREIKQFTGLTPRQMRESPNLLAQLTIAQRWTIAGQVAPLVSET